MLGARQNCLTAAIDNSSFQLLRLGSQGLSYPPEKRSFPSAGCPFLLQFDPLRFILAADFKIVGLATAPTRQSRSQPQGGTGQFDLVESDFVVLELQNDLERLSCNKDFKLTQAQTKVSFFYLNPSLQVEFRAIFEPFSYILLNGSKRNAILSRM